ncbi:DUF6192 family protein [Streptomyces klenkii]|uniref:DUF6192 family protein n=1 Tax=Streptomyces klenkii TaxID=1420899 RepID=UPI0033B6541B
MVPLQSQSWGLLPRVVLDPVTVEEMVKAIRDPAADKTRAGLAACDLLRRPEVAFRAMRDQQARELVNRAQFVRAELVDDEGEKDWWDEPEDETVVSMGRVALAELLRASSHETARS